MHSKTRILTTTIALGAASALAWLGSPEERQERSLPKEAVVVLMSTSGSDVEGVVEFHQMEDQVRITGRVTGLSPGKHGFHIHEFGDLRDPSGKSAGGHYNPAGVQHGAPDDPEHHVGDLGNIVATADGVATIDKKVKGLKLHYIIGRAVVVHGGEDDLKSQPSGAAGPRVGAGVIGFAQIEKGQAGGNGR